MTPFLPILLLSLGPGLPLLLALCCLWKRLRRFAWALLPAAALPALFTAMAAPAGVTVQVPWFFMGSGMGLDPLGRVFLFSSALLWWAASLFSIGYLRSDGRRAEFSFFFLVAMCGNFGLILAQEVLGFYLFFSLMSLAAYGVVVHRRNERAMRAGRVYLLLAVFGEVLLFVALLLLVRREEGMLLFLLLFFGFGIKAGALPLHGWLPLAHPVAPAPASAVLSGAMIKAGLLGWLRFLPSTAPGAATWGGLFVVAGAAASIYGVVAGLRRDDAKTVLAYSSISQMGLMTIVVGCGLLAPQRWQALCTVAALYALHHALAKGSLFLGVGMGRGGRLPVFAGLLIASLSLAGFPLSSGALAKQGLKEAIAALGAPLHDPLLFLLPVAACGTMALLVHFLGLWRSTEVEEWDAAKSMQAGWLVLVAASLLLPWVWGAKGEFAGASAPWHVPFWSALWPLLLGVCCGVMWHWRARPLWQQGEKGVCRVRERTLLVALLRLRKVLAQAAFFMRRAWVALAVPPRLARFEKIFQRWSVAVSLYLLVVLVLSALLCLGG